MLAAQRGRKHAKKAVGWVARQSGWLVSRVRTEIDTARKVARDEFERARDADPAPVVDVVVPSARVADANGAAEMAKDGS